jgi:hypothetical protein
MSRELLVKKALGLKEGIGLMKPKERERQPHRQFAEQFNLFLQQVKDDPANGDIFSLLPKPIEIKIDSMVTRVGASYGEIYSYLAVIERLLT